MNLNAAPIGGAFADQNEREIVQGDRRRHVIRNLRFPVNVRALRMRKMRTARTLDSRAGMKRKCHKMPINRMGIERKRTQAKVGKRAFSPGFKGMV